jgi:hypothetical protein
MNALVGIRANTTGLMSLPSAKRLDVAQTLAMGSRASVEKAGLVSKMESGSPSLSSVPEQELDRDAFLQLLVLQLQNQDPTEPMDSQQLLAQLAQFTALEQAHNLTDSIDEMSGNIDQLNFISASQMLGRTVRGLSLSGLPQEGVVERVRLDGSTVILTVNGQQMSMAGVVEIDGTPGTNEVAP